MSPDGLRRPSGGIVMPQPATSLPEPSDKPSLWLPVRGILWSLILAVVLIAATLLCRPLLPPDETRYLSVAWEAHVRGDFLVSHLNGDPYSHKPPLLFWLINAVWALTGVSEFAARLVSPAAGIVCVLLTRQLAVRLWPDDRRTAFCAPMMLVSSMLWMCFGSATMFDTLLTCFTLAALLGILRAQGGAPLSGWIITGAAIGFGVLSKGPVVLVHVLPAALLAPWWSATARAAWLRWYGGSILAIVIGAAMGLAWAIPSAMAGGPDYGKELLFGQTAGRMVNSFAHCQPFWWYLPILPGCLCPWILFGAFWRGCRIVKTDSSLRFLICCTGGSFLILSAVSGKQAYYLLPMLPACILIMARTASVVEHVAVRDQLPIVLGTVFMGSVPFIVSQLGARTPANLAGLIDQRWSILLVLCGLIPGVLRTTRPATSVASIGTAAVAFITLLHLSLSGGFWNEFNMRPLAEFVSRQEQPVAWYGNYNGELNFPGRIPRIHEVATEDELREWLSDDPSRIAVIRLPNSLKAAIEYPSSEVATDHTTHIDASVLAANTDLTGHAWSPQLLFRQTVRKGLATVQFGVMRFDAVPADTGNPDPLVGSATRRSLEHHD